MTRNRYWTEEEDAILTMHYGEKDVNWQEVFPYRSTDSTKRRAHRLGLHKLVANDLAKKKRAVKQQPKTNTQGDTRDYTARFFGDPLPGRSALDRRQGRQF